MSKDKPIQYKIELSEEDRAARPVVVNPQTQRVIDKLKANAKEGEDILSLVRSPKLWPQLDYADEEAPVELLEAEFETEFETELVEDEDTEDDPSLPLAVAQAERQEQGKLPGTRMQRVLLVLLAVLAVLVWFWRRPGLSVQEAEPHKVAPKPTVVSASKPPVPEPAPVPEPEPAPKVVKPKPVPVLPKPTPKSVVVQPTPKPTEVQPKPVAPQSTDTPLPGRKGPSW